MGCIVAQLTYKVLFAIYQYVGANAFNRYILCKHLSLLALGRAVLSRVPIPGDCFGLARSADVTLIATGFPVYPFCVQYVKE